MPRGLHPDLLPKTDKSLETLGAPTPQDSNRSVLSDKENVSAERNKDKSWADVVRGPVRGKERSAVLPDEKNKKGFVASALSRNNPVS